MSSIKEQVTFSFMDNPPKDYNDSFHLVSGEDSIHYRGIKYLTLHFNDNGQELVFEIRYQYGGCSFEDIEITDSVIAVGHESYFYLYDYINFKSLTTKEMSGYFSNILYDSNFFYVADWDKVFKFDTKGSIIWTSNSSIAHDGIHLHEIINNRLTGTGNFDPPYGDWYDFVLDVNTGDLLEGGERLWLAEEAKKLKETKKVWWKF